MCKYERPTLLQDKVCEYDKPLISIITVSYNDISGLVKTIDNIRSISYENISFIVIDGGSTDGTVDILRSNDDIIDYWVSESDNGIYDAMNKGWDVASNDSCILFLGCGDTIYSLPDTSKKLLEQVTFGDVLIDGGLLFSSTCDWRLKAGNTIHHQALLVPKKFHLSPPFSSKYKVYADYDFNLRLYKSGVEIVKSNSFLGGFSTGGLSGAFNAKEMLTISFKNFPFFFPFTVAYLTYRWLKIRLF